MNFFKSRYLVILSDQQFFHGSIIQRALSSLQVQRKPGAHCYLATLPLKGAERSLNDRSMEKLRISPEFSKYAEEKQLFTLYEGLLQELIATKPQNPLQFLIDYFSRCQDNTPRVIIYGPTCSGQNSISKLTVRKLRLVHVIPKRVLEEDKSAAGKEAQSLKISGREISASLWATMIHSRLQKPDCLSKGWVLEGFPRSREQALILHAKGIMPAHFVHLECPDRVLIERYSGKRIDPLTGDVYHLVFNVPKSESVAARLVEEPEGIQENLYDKLELYHRNSTSLLSCYKRVSKRFNADQPLEDLFSQVYGFLCTHPRSVAPLTPRVILYGPTGSGKSLQAAKLAEKYNLVNVDCREMIRKTLSSDSVLASQVRPFKEKKMLIPDDMVLHMITDRLSQADCVFKGWVMHGFPLTRNQADLLNASGHKPNRVYFLDISEEPLRERLTMRRVDPLTGERYHLMMKLPESQEIINRLEIHPRDSEEQVTQRLELYNGFVEDVIEYYESGQHINADQSPATVFEVIETLLVNPLPKLHNTI